jgi:glycerol kinase
MSIPGIPELTEREQKWAQMSHAARTALFESFNLEYEASIHAWLWKLPEQVKRVIQ